MNFLQKKKNEFSEGEELIGEFFKEKGIDYKTEVELKNLKGDTAPKRIADFYLPKYKVFLEFFGRWNVSKGDKERYLEKKSVYNLNNIPCIYLYPENLGIINFLFKRRLRQLLKKRKDRKWQLVKFYWESFQEENIWGIVFILILIFAVKGVWGYTFAVLVFIFMVYEFLKKDILRY